MPSGSLKYAQLIDLLIECLFTRNLSMRL